MFSKPTGSPAGPITLIAAATELQGDLRVRGALRVEGAVYGNVRADGHMSLGPAARIVGEVRANTLAVAGRIDGIVQVRDHLHVLRGGVVRGHARYQSLQIERGGVMDGTTAPATDLPESSADEEDEYVAAE